MVFLMGLSWGFQKPSLPETLSVIMDRHIPSLSPEEVPGSHAESSQPKHYPSSSFDLVRRPLLHVLDDQEIFQNSRMPRKSRRGFEQVGRRRATYHSL